jgi:inner membrane protein
LSSVFTHAFAGAALAVIGEARPSAATITIAAVCGVLPDADGIGYFLGIPYGSIFGHRGFLHSLLFAALLAAALTLAVFREMHPVYHFFLFFLATVSHGVLDAMTDGGLGVAFFSPFDTNRYFFPFRPLLVPPIGVRPFFTRYGLSVFLSEVRWVWLPLTVLMVAVHSLIPRRGQ